MDSRVIWVSVLSALFLFSVSPGFRARVPRVPRGFRVSVFSVFSVSPVASVFSVASVASVAPFTGRGRLFADRWPRSRVKTAYGSGR